MTLILQVLSVLRDILIELWNLVSKQMADLLSRILGPKTSPDSSSDPQPEQ